MSAKCCHMAGGCYHMTAECYMISKCYECVHTCVCMCAPFVCVHVCVCVHMRPFVSHDCLTDNANEWQALKFWSKISHYATCKF